MKAPIKKQGHVSRVPTKYLEAAARKRLVFLNVAGIAGKAGVQRGAVYQALYGGPGVSEATRAKILRVMGIAP